MTSTLGPQGSPDPAGLDLLAVNRDADLLDLLAKRGPLPSGDPVLALLAALAADVDEGLDELLVGLDDDDALVAAVSTATVVPHLPVARHGHGLRATTLAIVVGATLSIGGVAAAVTGDPLAPVKGIVTAMGGHGADQHPGKARAFGAGKQAGRQIHGGDLAGARVSLDAMRSQLARTDLSKGDRQAIEAKLAALERKLARATPLAEDDGRGQGQGNGYGKAKGAGQRDDEGRDAAVTPATKPTGKPVKPATGSGRKPSTTPNSDRTAEPPATGKNKDKDGSGATVDDSTSKGSGGSHQGQATPTSASDSGGVPTATATADPTGSGATGGGTGNGNGNGDGNGKAARGASTGG